VSVDYLAEHLRAVPPHRALLRAVECKLMGQVPLTPPVLDIGAGDGHFASAAYDRPIDAGVDVRLRDLREARARPGVYRALLAASATALPFRDAAFNTVVSNCAIEHIPSLCDVLGEIARVLRPSGTFATTLPSEHFPEFLAGSRLLGPVYGRFFNRISHHYHVHPPEWWSETLASAGLRVVEQRYYFSPAAHRAFDLSHYAGVPNLIARLLTGSWALRPFQARLLERWFRPYYEEPWPEVGAYQFVRCERMA
jgi:SAM-dependent methyltransferase